MGAGAASGGFARGPLRPEAAAGSRYGPRLRPMISCWVPVVPPKTEMNAPGRCRGRFV